MIAAIRKALCLCLLLAMVAAATGCTDTVTGTVLRQADDDEYVFETDDGRTVTAECENDRKLPVGQRVELKGKWDDDEFEVNSFRTLE